MKTEVTGKVLIINELEQISDKFCKRSFVVEEENEINGQVYLNPVKMTMVNNNCDKLDHIDHGDTVEVKANVRGFSWEKNGQTYYGVDVQAWYIKKLDGNTGQDVPEYEGDDLPF